MDYKNHKGNYWKIAKVHHKGWSYNDWSILGITDKNCKSYLSTRDYCALHPFNGNYSTWIDDKLTLKYILEGTSAGKYMPDYYFQLEGKGIVLPLMNIEPRFANKGIEGIVELLEEKHSLAFKLIKSSLGVGFYKVEYKENTYTLNEERLSRDEFIKRITELKGYIVTEYLFPHPYFAKFCEASVGCLRYLIGRMNNGQLKDIYSFMRLGTTSSKFVENYNSGGVLMIVGNGSFNGGNVLDFTALTNKCISCHPDNGLPLVGIIPHWEEVVEAAHSIADSMPQLSYMGIDFCITNDDRIKIIEINSLTSLECFQIDKSILETSGGDFFKEKLNAIS